MLKNLLAPLLPPYHSTRKKYLPNGRRLLNLAFAGGSDIQFKENPSIFQNSTSPLFSRKGGLKSEDRKLMMVDKNGDAIALSPMSILKALMMMVHISFKCQANGLFLNAPILHINT